MYHYYVSYWVTNKKGQQTMGFAEIERNNPIKYGTDVAKLAADIKKSQKVATVTIMNWIKLEG